MPANVRITVTREEAIDMALPCIEDYAKENSRIIKNVNVSFSSSVRDIQGSRGNSSLRYPEWSVEAEFYASEDKTNRDITGYIVLIWADNGEICHKGIQGYY